MGFRDGMRTFWGATKSGARVSTSLVGRMVTPGKVTLFLIIMILSTLSSIAESVRQGTPAPLIINAGGRLFNADALLYHKATHIKPWVEVSEIQDRKEDFKEAKGWSRFVTLWGTWTARAKQALNIGSFFFSILSSLYTFFMTYFIFIYLVGTHNDSEKIFNYIFAAILILLLGALYGSFVYYVDNVGQYDSKNINVLTEFGTAVNPVKGVVYTISHSDEVFGPLLGKIKNIYPVNTAHNDSLPTSYNLTTLNATGVSGDAA